MREVHKEVHKRSDGEWWEWDGLRWKKCALANA